jgi:hypothetical protein
MPLIMSFKKRKQLVLRCGAVIAVLGAMLVLSVVRQFTRGPAFSGDAPVSIGVVAEQPDGTNFYETTITNLQACSNVLNVLAEARWTDFHACPHRGWFHVEYTNGKGNTFYFLPGHDFQQYEIRCESGCFALSRARLWAALRAAGIDTSKLPQGEQQESKPSAPPIDDPVTPLKRPDDSGGAVIGER